MFARSWTCGKSVNNVSSPQQYILSKGGGPVGHSGFQSSWTGTSSASLLWSLASSSGTWEHTMSNDYIHRSNTDYMSVYMYNQVPSHSLFRYRLIALHGRRSCGAKLFKPRLLGRSLCVGIKQIGHLGGEVEDLDYFRLETNHGFPFLCLVNPLHILRRSA